MTTVAEFLALSSTLTGFSPAELRGTGMVGAYQALVVQQAGAEPLDRLTATVARGGIGPSAFGDGPERELAQAIAQLWYLGTWPGLGGSTAPEQDAAFVVSARAYAEGLVWRTFGGHAPSTAAPGHGSWSHPPADPA
ncbi:MULTISPECIES: hypothetical protein [Kitasatospora]|uniref:hypothetical protein n=1 Tax=Kitasatospora TaxID=2063 RepID=UPI000C70F604|nr:hypothetical protein [Kitasatospora sp. GP30]MDH6144503.1 hypothetical protein [Kitasatospora sp. GP30]